jgi:nucleotide-binding universal stress UspA family protein
MFKHILVTTDGSPVSLHAARAATYLAKLSAARVTAWVTGLPRNAICECRT